MSESVRQLLERHVAEKVIPGAVALVDRHGELTVDAVGAMALHGPPMHSDAIMRIQSMTKPITTVATLRHVEAGRLDLDDPVERWLPNSQTAASCGVQTRPSTTRSRRIGRSPCAIC